MVFRIKILVTVFLFVSGWTAWAASSNSAPILDAAASPALTSIDEDPAANPGNTVEQIITDGSVTDPDGTAEEAVAVISVEQYGGVWQYSVNGGADWLSFSPDTGGVSDFPTAARLLRGTDRIRFVPDAEWSGTSGFRFRAWDQSSGVAGGTADADSGGGSSAFSAASDRAGITVSSVNDPPVITGQAALSTPEETALTISLTHLRVSDPDSDWPGDFSLHVLDGANYSRTGNTVTPVSGFHWTLTVPVYVNDGTDDSSVFNLSVTVFSVRIPPVITGQSQITMPEDTSLVLTLGHLTVSDADSAWPGDFTLTVRDGENYTRTGNEITPDEHFSGTLRVPVTVRDSEDNSPVFNLEVTVLPVNDAPTAEPDRYDGGWNTPLPVPPPGVLKNDTDIENDSLSAVLEDEPLHGTLILNPDGSFEYTPETYFTGTDVFTYRASDGTDSSEPAAVTLNLTFTEGFENGFGNWTATGLWNPENQADACGAAAAPFPTPEAAAYYGNDAACNYVTGSAAADGELMLDGAVQLPSPSPGRTAAFSFMSFEETECGGNCGQDRRFIEISADSGETWTVLGQGGLEGGWYPRSFDLAPFLGESIFLRFRFDSVDGVDNAHWGWMIDDVAVTIRENPAAVNDLYTVPEDTILTVEAPGVLANDRESAENSPAAVLEEAPDAGVLSFYEDGGFSFDPPPDFSGDISFSYRIRGGTAEDSALVTIRVAPVNDPPVIAGHTALTVAEGEFLPLSLNDLTVHDSDSRFPDDFSLVILDGSEFLRSEGGVTPLSGVTGLLSVPVYITDGEDDSRVFLLSVSVTASPSLTTPEPPPSGVILISAAPDDANVSADSPISVVFTDLLNPETVNSDSFYLTAGGQTVPAVLTADGSTATLTPAEDLVPGMTYQAVLSGDIEDAYGSPVCDEYTWLFTAVSAGWEPGPDLPLPGLCECRETPIPPASEYFLRLNPPHESVISQASVTLSAETRNVSGPMHWRLRPADEKTWGMAAVSASGKNEYTVEGLESGLKYFWQAGFEREADGEMIWSEITAFRTGSRMSLDFHIDPGTEAADFRMISFPLWPDDSSFADVFGGGGMNRENFRIVGFDSAQSCFVEYGCDGFSVSPGSAYGLLARNGMDVSVKGVGTGMPHDFNLHLSHDPSTGSGWNLIASPADGAFYWGDLQVTVYDSENRITAGPLPLSEAPFPNSYLDHRLWRYENGHYEADAFELEPGRGYWMRVKREGVTLTFPAEARISEASIRPPDPGHQGEDSGSASAMSPPLPPGLEGECCPVTDSGGGGGGGCLIDSSAFGNRR